MSTGQDGFVDRDHVLNVYERIRAPVQLQQVQGVCNHLSQAVALLLAVVDPVSSVAVAHGIHVADGEQLRRM